MALFRSASGPTNLSISTSSANMFGSTSQTPAPAATGSLFGAAQTSSTTTPKPTSLFGASTTTPQAQQSSTPSLFGASTQTQSQPAAQGTPSLFGAAQSQTQPQQAQTSGGLFGNSTNVQPAMTTPSSGLGLFGGSRPAGDTPLGGQSAPQRPSLFGGLGQQTQPQSNPLAQSQQQPQQQQQPSLTLGSGLGFGLTMGQSNSQPTVPGVRIDVTNLKGTTRFNDLQENLQKMLEQADGFIAEQIRRKEEVDAFMSGHREMLESIPEDVKFVSRKCDGARNALESAAQSIESARLLVNQDADSARLSFRAVDNLKLPQQYHTSGFWSPRQQAPGNANSEADGQDLVGFFSKTADEMADQAKKYEKSLSEIEAHMHGVSDNLVEQLQRVMATKNGAPSGTDERIQELVAVLRDFEQSILKVAGNVGGAREGLTRLQVGNFMSPERDPNGVY
ncbi:hypothetical protein GGR50DRAFT_566496 [Xylaria sp. CBS 124048]|nr:hypothetical protein GGR50DRAFT_566496 [Xylaria sp. CBS 124048]